ncbi:hypothetical protein CBF45_07600 [Bordetella sp. J329]|nr:hypothetical protein CBF45_07600 [Bordetella sp. J329]
MPQRKITMKVQEVVERIPDAVGASNATNVTITAGSAGILSSIAGWNWPAIIASIVALLGLFANLWFQRRRDAREREMHQAQLDAIRSRCNL